MASSAWAALLGITMGTGLWSLASMLPRLSRPGLAWRVAPYLRDVSAAARELLDRRSAEPVTTTGALVAPAFLWLRGALGRLLGGPGTIELRLRQAGSDLSVDSFRSQQLAWSVSGFALGVVVSIAVGGAISPALAVALVGGCSVLGLVGRDYVLQRTARSRVARISAELPTVLEFLTLSLSAGEGILDALRRISRARGGELGVEFGRVIAEVNSGVPLAASLTSLAGALRLPALTRVIEQVIGALERGTPLAEVLRAQAQDSRDVAKRELLESAGKKEVAMLVPLVFLILPVTIAFAIFPGIAVLQIGL